MIVGMLLSNRHLRQEARLASASTIVPGETWVRRKNHENKTNAVEMQVLLNIFRVK